VDEPRYNVRVADHGYWREQIKCQYGLSGSHRCSRLRAGNCSGGLRTSVSDCPWPESLSLPLRPYLRCAVRSGLP
jgi:hypothetical protein